MARRTIVAFVSSQVICWLGVSSVIADKIYWVDCGSKEIRRADLNGGEFETLVQDRGKPVRLALDLTNGKVYWTNSSDLGSRIDRSNLDGTEIETVATRSRISVTGLAIDGFGEKLYWIERPDRSRSGQLVRADLDGTGSETFIISSRMYSLALDLVQGKAYWGVSTGGIRRTNLDGTQLETGFTTAGPEDIALDLLQRKVYWVESVNGTIRRANFDGTEIEDVLTGLGIPVGIALDVPRDRIYWTALNGVFRANLDGSDAEHLIAGFFAAGIALDVPSTRRPEVEITLDIKPTSCPNPLNTRSQGVLSAAVAGSESFDVTEVDDRSLFLLRADGIGGSVEPITGPSAWTVWLEDVTTPFEGELCDCHELGADGIDDLLMRFSTPETVAALGLDTEPKDTMIELSLRGLLIDGTVFSASDCVTIRGKAPPRRPPPRRLNVPLRPDH